MNQSDLRYLLRAESSWWPKVAGLVVVAATMAWIVWTAVPTGMSKTAAVGLVLGAAVSFYFLGVWRGWKIRCAYAKPEIKWAAWRVDPLSADQRRNLLRQEKFQGDERPVTDILRENAAKGYLIQPATNPDLGGRDPRRNVGKVLVIKYDILGQSYYVEVPEGERVRLG